jgi:hypothetical protein
MAGSEKRSRNPNHNVAKVRLTPAGLTFFFARVRHFSCDPVKAPFPGGFSLDTTRLLQDHCRFALRVLPRKVLHCVAPQLPFGYN